jgi:hypothetical protein
MSTVYACTFVSKEAERDDYEHGCDPDSRVTTMHESVNITAATLAGLVEKLDDHYFLEAKPGENEFHFDEINECSDLLFERLETNDCNLPSKQQMEEWKAGRLMLFACSYRFSVEKRVVDDVSPDEFKAAGIKSNNY